MPNLFGTNEIPEGTDGIPENFLGSNDDGLNVRVKMLERKFSTKALDKGYADQVIDELMHNVNTPAYWQGVTKGVNYNPNLSDSQRKRIMMYSGY